MATNFRPAAGQGASFHINDTHPGLAIPELMRLLIDQEGLGWDEAAQHRTEYRSAYTNHTVMAESAGKAGPRT